MNKEKVIRLCKEKGWRRKEFEKVNQLHGCNKANVLRIRRDVSNNSKYARVKRGQFRNTINYKFVKHND